MGTEDQRPSEWFRASLFRLFKADASRYQPGDWLRLADGRCCRVHQVRRRKLVVYEADPGPTFGWRRSPILEAVSDFENAAIYAS